jgi:hypothetical protein
MAAFTLSKPCTEEELNTLSFSNPQNLIGALETYVREQVTSHTYDFLANKKLLKLYQYYPDATKGDVVGQVMILSLMRLPSTDYVALSYLVAGRMSARDAKLQEIQTYAEMLESGKFCEFWTARNGRSDIIDNSKFDDCIRVFITDTIGFTFQNIKVDMLCGLLGFDSDTKLRAYATSNPGKFEVIQKVLMFMLF